MASALPGRPSLDWLRKTAKQQLRELHLRRPDARLADAQLAIAREYGFSSWRALKKHVDAQSKNSANTEFSDDVAVAGFLRDARSGAVDAVRAALTAAPSLVNCLGPHPHWGGRVQPLHMAIEGGNREVFELLLAAGADINGNNEFYESWSPLMLTENSERWAMRTELLDRGADIGLAEALVLGDDRRVDNLLQRGRSALAARPPGGGSWLTHARTPHAAQRLLELGADPAKSDVFGSTPVETFSRLGERGRPLVEILTRAGVEAKPREFARLGDRRALESLVGADPKIAHDEEVMMAAVDSGHHELVSWLLEKGANPNARTGFGSQATALHGAAWQGNMRMTEILVGAGANVRGLDVEHSNTPSGYARVARQITNNPACDAVAEYLEALERSS